MSEARTPIAGALVLLLATACASSVQRTPGAAGAAPEDFVRRITPFPVAGADGVPYEHPFLGGFDVPRPQFHDIDADGDPDLFVQERSNELVFFENTGTPEDPRFTWRTRKYQGLDIGEWSRFADLDGDGDLDLLAEEPYSHVRYYRNVGTASAPRFDLAADTLRTPSGEPIFADRQNIPSLADVDCDGLLDLFLGRVNGTITRYEMTRDGGDVPHFRFVEDRWQDIEIIGQVGPAPSPDAPLNPTRHGANAMAFADMDGDGDLDLLWGDFFEPSVLLIENRGSCEQPSYRSEPIALSAEGGLSTSGYNVPVPVDLDADGDLDLLIGVLGGAFNPNRTAADNLWFYERVEDGGLELRTRRFLDAVDVGSESVPALGDLDADGDLDLLVANKLDPGSLQTSRLYRFENTGGSDDPAFRLVDTLQIGGSYHYAPVLGDLDADGDLDLVVGTWNDEVQVYWNRGGADRFEPAERPATLVELPRGSNSTPALGDLDGDGDLDLIVGEASGTLNLFLNVGTRSEPRFELRSEEFLGLDAGRRSHPALADLDRDGEPDLLVGREDDVPLFFRNLGKDGEVGFEPARLGLRTLPYTAPTFGDLDGDGDPDLIAGALSGGLIYLENRIR